MRTKEAFHQVHKRYLFVLWPAYWPVGIKQVFPLGPRDMSASIRSENAAQVSFATRDVCSCCGKMIFLKKKGAMSPENLLAEPSG